MLRWVAAAGPIVWSWGRAATWSRRGRTSGTSPPPSPPAPVPRRSWIGRGFSCCTSTRPRSEGISRSSAGPSPSCAICCAARDQRTCYLCAGSKPGACVNLHEYQARELLRAAGIAMPEGGVAATAEEAEAIARRLGGSVVVKAQVHAGGRGKAGGVKLAKDAAEARQLAGTILGMSIKGLPVQKVVVVPAATIASESYVGDHEHFLNGEALDAHA